MRIKDAVKTKGKVFVYLNDPHSGFISDGTWKAPGFDFDDVKFMNHSDLDFGVEELDETWQKVAELSEGKERVIKFLFGSRGAYTWEHDGKEEIIGGK